MSALLDIQNVTRRFGGLAAVSGLDLSIAPHELVGLIGPNGAGKTTVFNVLTGVYPPTSGRILLDGQSIARRKPYAVARLGIARTFQNVRLFRRLTAADNVKIAANLQTRAGLMAAIWRTRGLLANDQRLDAAARALLERLGLGNVMNSYAGDLPYGLQRRLEIARALGTRPKLLLLDEPAAGMNPLEKAELMETIRAIRDDFDLTILLIEHDMTVVMGICERIYVLDYGEVIAEGPPARIRTDPKVIAAYLGEEDGSEAAPLPVPDATGQ